MMSEQDYNTRFGKQATEVIKLASMKNIILATAESCTGGLIMASLTDVAGSSAVVDRGFITYTNKSKMQALGVKAETLRAHGAVSEETAGEMAIGALSKSAAQICISVTGIAGPGGGTPEKPAGMVCFGLALRSSENASICKQTKQFGDIGRANVRAETVLHALAMLKDAINEVH